MSARPRTFADQLRGWSAERVAALLTARPDLIAPAPADSGQLAARATTRRSCQHALDGLTRLELAVLDAVVVAGTASADRIEQLVNAPAGDVREALARLTDLALTWESPSGHRAITGAAEALAVPPGGGSGIRPLGSDGRDTGDAVGRLDRLSPAARGLLDHVAAKGGEARTGEARTTISADQAATPAEELLALRLLVPRADGRAVIPGEVQLALRDGRTTSDPVSPAPAIATAARDQALVDRTAAGAAFEAVRRTELLLDTWGAHPPAVLRSGGLAVRDLKAAARLLHQEEPATALLIECAAEAGLLARGVDADGDPVWLPTDAYDAWSARPVADRWQRLVSAWLSMSRLPMLVGGRDAGGKARNALSGEPTSVYAGETRLLVVRALAELPAGETLASATGLPSLVARLAWQRPRRPRSQADLAAQALAEAAELGVVALHGPASYARSLPGDVAPELAPLLPAPVDKVLLQADLTAVAPGPLVADVARDLHLLADVESRGGASVYRFGKASLRRGFDGGWSAGEIHEFLARIAATPVPQPLSYLVDDVARTFGTLRVGAVGAFLRADDAALLDELLAHAPSLGLRRIAPTVLVSSLTIDVLLPRLREAGAAPVVEAPDGSVRLARPDQLRARKPAERARSPRAATEARAAAVAAAIRSGDEAAAARPGPAQATTPAEVLTTLRAALEDRAPVWIGYVDNHGTSSERIVDPRSVEGGHLVAYDRRADDVRGFAIHRITGVRRLPD